MTDLLTKDAALAVQETPPVKLTVSGSVSPLSLLQMAIEREGSIDVIERLAKLQTEMMDREARLAYIKAFEEFKATAPTIVKDCAIMVNESVRGKFAKLDQVCDKLVPALLAVGITHRWKTTEGDNGRIVCTCYLRHRMGHEEQGSTIGAPPDTSGSKNAVQAVGSTVSYLERYTLVATCGIAVKDQDTVDNPGMTLEAGADWVSAIEGAGTAEETMRVWTNATNAAKKLEDYKSMTVFTEARDRRLKEIKRAK